jgi:protein SCO1/2
VLNAARESLEKLDWVPGDHYRIVTISIDPKEDADLAREKKKSILGAVKNEAFRAGAADGWNFLVGKAGSEKRLAAALGFRYKWDSEEKQWAHGAALFVLSPTGRLSRVLFGVDFPPRDLKLALLEAGEGKVGTIAEKLMLFCYHYDPKGNKYAILASRLVSLGGALTVSALLLAWVVWFIRQARRKGTACPVSP